jgi:hypothetical protein
MRIIDNFLSFKMHGFLINFLQILIVTFLFFLSMPCLQFLDKSSFMAELNFFIKMVRLKLFHFENRTRILLFGVLFIYFDAFLCNLLQFFILHFNMFVNVQILFDVFFNPSLSLKTVLNLFNELLCWF